MTRLALGFLLGMALGAALKHTAVFALAFVAGAAVFWALLSVQRLTQWLVSVRERGWFDH